MKLAFADEVILNVRTKPMHLREAVKQWLERALERYERCFIGRALHNFYRNIMLSQVFSEVSIATTYRCLNMADAFINLGLNFWLMSIWIKIVRNAQDSLSHNIPVLGIIGPSRGFKTLHLQCRVV